MSTTTIHHHKPESQHRSVPRRALRDARRCQGRSQRPRHGTASSPDFPPALKERIAADVDHIYCLATWVAADMRQEEPGWALSLGSLHAYIEWEPHFRVERIAGSCAHVGYTEFNHEKHSAHCILFLPRHVDPKQEMLMLAWGLGYFWKHVEDAYYSEPLPSTYGHNPLEMARAKAILAGLAYDGPEVRPWKQLD